MDFEGFFFTRLACNGIADARVWTQEANIKKPTELRYGPVYRVACVLDRVKRIAVLWVCGSYCGEM